jgi:hypothetical protein
MPAVDELISINSSGRLVPLLPNEFIMLPKRVPLIANQTVAFSFGNTNTPNALDRFGLVLKNQGGEALIAMWNSTGYGLYYYNYGISAVLTSGTFSNGALAANTDYWGIVRFKDNLLTIGLYLADPTTPNFAGTAKSTYTHTLTGTNLAKFGSGLKGLSGLYFNAESGVYSTMWMDNLSISSIVEPSAKVSVFNRGNWRAKCITTIRGPIIGGFQLFNRSNGLAFNWSKDLLTGDVLILDSINNLVTDASGEEKFEGFDFASDLIVLEPRNNNLELVAANVPTGAGIVSVVYSDSWM